MGTFLDQRAVGAHVRRLRRGARLSLRALAAAAGFSPSLISQVETGKVSPSIHSMGKIAVALGTSLGGFFAALQPGDHAPIARARARRSARSTWSHARIEVVGPLPPECGFEALLITLRPGGRSGKQQSTHAAREFAFVLEGRVALRLGAHEYKLSTGDAAVIQPNEPQAWTNIGRVRCRVLIVALTP